MIILKSIISPESIAEMVVEEYGFRGPLKCNLIKAGGSNDIYEIINNNKKYIVKIYSHRECWPYDLYHYLFEVELQNYLSNCGLSIPKPITNLKNSLVNIVSAPEYDKYYVVYTFLKGKVCEYKSLDPETFFLMGKRLAQLHHTSQNFQPSTCTKRLLDIDFLLNEPYKRIKLCGKRKFFSHVFFERIDRNFCELEEDLKKVNLSSLKMGVIHGDMHPENYFLDEQKSVISFLDFELSGHGYLIYDLATFKWKFLLSNKDRHFKNKFESFIKGYLLTMPQLYEEISLMNIFVRLRHFFILGSSIILYPDTSQLIYEKNFIEYLNSLKL